VPLIKTEGKKG